MSVLSAAYMHDESAAFEHVESLLWPDGTVCPHCGVVDNAYKLTGVRSKPSKKNPEGKERHGLYKCKECGKQYTVRKGTIFEESHIDLHLWLQAIHLMVSSKKGISSHQLARTLEITQKSAWFLSHRIREAMRDGDLSPMGGGGGVVEADETFIGNDPDRPKKPGQRHYHHKMKVLSLVDRNSGRAKSFVVDAVNKNTILPILQENMAREARLFTDEGSWYLPVGREFADHQTVQHRKDEYVRGEVTTNTVEGYFSIFKRGMKGVYQHTSKRHLHRYLAEFDFRYNHRIANGVDDRSRATIALQSIVGKRLTYAQ
ncbi:IS1595 family transposase [Sinisalibacter aestuarii]|uniref:DDE transposase n=1 Tax=Sinisalibacter aestuarii TaxID=2949426 RepID=A0ABQ5LP40_9RHOB|nr:IS1595 family transposase [Sinisalibacter aestuarii]GKY86757.1 DDE transposase [Sinisalibacter aestuarii]